MKLPSLKVVAGKQVGGASPVVSLDDLHCRRTAMQAEIDNARKQGAKSIDEVLAALGRLRAAEIELAEKRYLPAIIFLGRACERTQALAQALVADLEARGDAALAKRVAETLQPIDSALNFITTDGAPRAVEGSQPC